MANTERGSWVNRLLTRGRFGRRHKPTEASVLPKQDLTPKGVRSRAILNAFDLASHEEQARIEADPEAQIPESLFRRGLIAGELSDNNKISREEGLGLLAQMEGAAEENPGVKRQLKMLEKDALGKIQNL